MSTKSLNPLLIFIGISLLWSCTSENQQPEVYQPDIIISWNQLILKTAVAEDGLLTLKGVRTAAMAHIAIHDALNAIQPRYQPYTYGADQAGAHPLAAAAQAAYEVVVSQYPDQQAQWQSELEKWLGALEDSTDGVSEGKELGAASARKILEQRAEDAWNSEAEYTWHPMAPGVYAEFKEHSGTPEGFIFGAGWARAQPFMLEEPGQFRSPPPPEINSDAYTEAFNEVKEVGRDSSQTRTEDQAHLAMWWKDFVENSHNRLARELVDSLGLDLWESARVFALLNMTVFDAYVNVFDNKFHYNHWRPYTAIRWAENDENSDTEADPEWDNLHHHTYAFPSYPSAHGSASSAAMTVLAETLGTGDEYAFTMRTEQVDKAGPMGEKIAMDPPTRQFDRFSEAGLEAAMSRVYLGIHFRYDSEEGHRLGTEIGNYAADNFLLPVYQ